MPVTVTADISRKIDVSEDHDSPERIARAKAKLGHITPNTDTLLAFLDAEEDRELVSYRSVEEEDVPTASKRSAALKELQEMFAGRADECWGSEEEMIADMAEFRRSRLAQ